MLPPGFDPTTTKSRREPHLDLASPYARVAVPSPPEPTAVSRPLPIVRAGGWYHVVNRGIERSVLFPTSEAKDGFVLALGGIAYDFAVEVHAYCAMESHLSPAGSR